MKSQRYALTLALAFLISPSQRASAQGDQGLPPDSSQTTSDQQARHRHHGGKDEIDAIGSRKIGKTGWGNWYSLESEIQLGKEYAMIVESEVKLLRDPMVNEYVNRIAQNLMRNSDAKVPFTVKVIDSEEINSFTLPGGFLYVHTGLILAADDEAELAGVMAHEIAHVAARHATRQMTRNNLFNLASIPLIFVGGGAGYAVQQAFGLVVPLSLSKFSRDFEAEADYLGLEYMYKAGYDPQAYISFFERLQAREKKPGVLVRTFATHPPTANRIRKSQVEIASILPVREQYMVSTSDFDAAKARLSAIGNRVQSSGGNRNKPTLIRRTPTSGTDSSDDSTDDHDRPVLKRRGQDSE